MVADSIVLLPGLIVSRETEARLRQFVKLVEKWNPRINLVSANSLSEIWTRHILDSAQLFIQMPQISSHLADLGSGGGFPGLVIGILAQEFHPSLRITLVESDKRKATFLRTAARELHLQCAVHTTRIESTALLQADVLTARALGSLTQLLGFAQRHLTENGTALFPKGITADQEITLAQQDWTFELVSVPSSTADGAQILRIRKVRHV